MDYTALGLRIRLARKRLKLTQRELAGKIGVSTSFIGHIERGTRVVSLETFVLLCRALGESPDRMLDPISPMEMPALTAPQQEQLNRLLDDVYALVRCFQKT